MKIDERHLAQLAAVVEAGGVSEAATLLGLTQPAVSRTISMLEARLGEPLFKRKRRPLQPTTLGRQLAVQGKVILAASRKASEVVQTYKRGTAGIVRLAGPPFFVDAVVSPMLAEFQNDNPDIRIDLSYGYLTELQAAIQADQIDIAISPIGLIEPGSGLTFRELLPSRNVVACGVTHPLMKKRPLRTSDLLAYPWIAPLPDSPLLADMHSLLLAIGMSQVNIRYSGGSLLNVLNVLAKTDALTVLPHSVVFAERKKTDIAILPLEIPQPERSLGFLLRADTAPLPAVARLTDFIERSFRDLRHLIKRHENAVVWGA